MSRILRVLYSALTVCPAPAFRASCAVVPWPKPGYAKAISERFGRYPQPIDSPMPHSSTDALGRFVWIHAVSLETRAAAILLTEAARPVARHAPAAHHGARPRPR